MSTIFVFFHQFFMLVTAVVAIISTCVVAGTVVGVITSAVATFGVFR